MNIIPFIIGGAGFLLLKSLTGTKQLIIRPSILRHMNYPQRQGQEEQTSERFKLELAIENPNSNNIIFSSIKATASNNAKQIASIELQQQFDLPGKVVTVVPIMFSVERRMMPDTFWEAIKNNQDAGDRIDINGFIYAGSLKTAVNKKFDI